MVTVAAESDSNAAKIILIKIWAIGNSSPACSTRRFSV
jgi:hypothetical protein